MKMLHEPVLPWIVVLIVEDEEASVVVAPTYVVSSKWKCNDSQTSSSRLRGVTIRLEGSLQKVPASVMKYKAMTAIQGMLLHNRKFIRRTKNIIVVVPSHGGVRRRDPRTIPIIIMVTDTRDKGTR
jgi:hypothetical protein